MSHIPGLFGAPPPIRGLRGQRDAGPPRGENSRTPTRPGTRAKSPVTRRRPGTPPAAVRHGATPQRGPQGSTGTPYQGQSNTRNTAGMRSPTSTAVSLAQRASTASTPEAQLQLFSQLQQIVVELSARAVDEKKSMHAMRQQLDEFTHLIAAQDEMIEDLKANNEHVAAERDEALAALRYYEDIHHITQLRQQQNQQQHAASPPHPRYRAQAPAQLAPQHVPLQRQAVPPPDVPNQQFHPQPQHQQHQQQQQRRDSRDDGRHRSRSPQEAPPDDHWRPVAVDPVASNRRFGGTPVRVATPVMPTAGSAMPRGDDEVQRDPTQQQQQPATRPQRAATPKAGDDDTQDMSAEAARLLADQLRDEREQRVLLEEQHSRMLEEQQRSIRNLEARLRAATGADSDAAGGASARRAANSPHGRRGLSSRPVTPGRPLPAAGTMTPRQREAVEPDDDTTPPRRDASAARAHASPPDAGERHGSTDSTTGQPQHTAGPADPVDVATADGGSAARSESAHNPQVAASLQSADDAFRRFADALNAVRLPAGLGSPSPPPKTRSPPPVKPMTDLEASGSAPRAAGATTATTRHKKPAGSPPSRLFPRDDAASAERQPPRAIRPVRDVGRREAPASSWHDDLRGSRASPPRHVDPDSIRRRRAASGSLDRAGSSDRGNYPAPPSSSASVVSTTVSAAPSQQQLPQSVDDLIAQWRTTHAASTGQQAPPR